MEPPADICRRWDLFGTLLSSVILVVGSLTALFGSQLIGQARQMYAEFGDLGLPIVSKVAMKLQQAHLPAVFIVSLLFLGVFMLVKIPDRQRANLYAGLTGILLGLTGGGLIAVALLPMLKIFSLMGA
ncbi:MAG: hypothetical protein CFE26_11315 [Verrucomicrobiales bacterium VVV1]|nr:MAG: hypothetical protein CFE26_11315 [Verrucomicrobiales bacterium VVV1]